SDADGNLRRIQLHAVFPRAHRVASAVDGIAKFQAQRSIATSAVNHSSCKSAPVRNFGQDVSPHRGVLASTIIDHHNGTRRHVIDEFAHRASWLSYRTIEHRECAPSEAKARVARLDVQTLSGDAQPIKRVADRCRIKLARADN